MKPGRGARHRWSVFFRCVAAALGGYAVVTLSHLAVTAALPAEPHQTLLFSSQTGYLVWTALILWCFAARTAARAWLGLALLALPLGAIDAWYLLGRGLA